MKQIIKKSEQTSSSQRERERGGTEKTVTEKQSRLRLDAKADGEGFLAVLNILHNYWKIAG